MILDEYYPVERTFETHSRIDSGISLKSSLLRQELDAFFEEIEELNLNDNSPSSIHVDKHPSLEDMTFIYIVSNNIYSEKNMYKIGKHKGTKKMLIKRYKTYLIEPIVYLFFPTGTVSSDECALLDRFSKFRLGTSEFLQMPIDKLLDSVHLYFKTKYHRTPTVQIPYHRCLYQQDLYDFVDKKIQMNKWSTERSTDKVIYRKCEFFPYLDFSDISNCLKRVEMRLENRKIFDLDLSKIDMDFLTHASVVDFIRCFMIEFDRKNFILYLERFMENGLNDFLVEMMKRIYGYHSFKILSRREFLLKESFPERLILIKKSDEPMEILLEKIQWLECCVLIEDKNIYSVENREICSYISFEDLFYYFFYVL